MRQKPSNYLRSERRRAALSQADIAELLREGVRAISRYERGRRLPPLKTALAYEAIYGMPAAELFAGTFDRIRKEVRRRARSLIADGGGSGRNGRRKESLDIIAAR